MPLGSGSAALVDPRVRRALSISILEGVSYALMVGFGESYFVADALRLGGSRLQLGLVVSLPLFLGGLGPLLGLSALSFLSARRRLVVGACTCQALGLFLLAWLDRGGHSSPALLIALASLHQIFGQATGTAWSSWYGDLVPSSIRGRYFARRTRYVQAATCVGLLGAGGMLQVLEPVAPRDAAGLGGVGFTAVFTIAGCFRLVSAVLLATTYEPRFRGLSAGHHLRRFLGTRRGRTAWRLVLSGAAFQLAVYLSSPYFQPYMLGALHFSYIEYTLATVTIVLLKVLMLPAWGRVIDHHGARSTYTLAGLLAALVPMVWLWAAGLGWVLVAQAFSGLAWAGYEVSYFALLLETSFLRTRAQLFAFQALANGSAQFLGSLLGAWILGLPRGFQLAFASSLLLRLAVASGLPRFIPATGRGHGLRRREVLLRVIGLRPHGGLVHRPILGGPSRPGEEREPGRD